jgi:hypothetical protein
MIKVASINVGELPTAKASWIPGSSSTAILKGWSYRLSPGVISRGSRGSLVQDFSGCIDIPIMDCITNRTLPHAYLQRHHFHLNGHIAIFPLLFQNQASLLSSGNKHLNAGTSFGTWGNTPSRQSLTPYIPPLKQVSFTG